MRAIALRLAIAVLAGQLGLLSAAAASPGEASPDGAWVLVEPAQLLTLKAAGARPWVRPDKFKAVKLDEAVLGGIFRQAPRQRAAAREEPVLLSLPTPAGTFDVFVIWESPVMEPALAEWMAGRGWPMKTYAGQGLTDPLANVRLDFGGPAGFHASVYIPGESYQIDPYWQGDRQLYTSYYRKDYTPDDVFSCLLVEHYESFAREFAWTAPSNTLRNFRLANAATAEYTAFHGGTPALGQAAIVTTVNRVNQVYARDLSVFLTLVSSNQLLVYTNSASDPYSNNDGVAMLAQNQTNIDAVIGNSNYDIGHVFSTGGGGVASLGVVCSSGNKARGVTGRGSPQGDPFDIDYVAHEMGHQFNANHTFDGVLGSCSGGNRNDSTAYEPGSGVTIMGYAGICGSDDLQSNSDALFHSASLDEILNFVDGLSCHTSSNSLNYSAPTVEAGSNYTIPANTPFELTASGADNDGDSLTYSWEQFDLSAGSSGDLLSAGDQGDNPIFRTWVPTNTGTRIFPRLSDLVSGTNAAGETLPTTSRTMTFRVVVRDNHAGGGLAGDDTMTVTVTTAAGPFRLTSPNGGETLAGMITVQWAVAGTDLAPVSSTNVEITCSLDGGGTFTNVLSTSTANDGSATLFLPNTSNNTARVKVKSAQNIFFDVSDTNFSLRTYVAPGSLQFGSAAYSVSESNSSVTLTVTRINGSTGAASVQYATLPGTASAGSDYASQSGTLSWPDGDSASREISVAIVNDSDSEGDETFTVGLSAAVGASLGSPSTATVTIEDDEPAAPTGLSASDGAYTNKVRLTWNSAANATNYEVWRSSGNNSNSAAKLGDSATTNYDDTSAASLPGQTLYYWVKAKNAQTTSAFSASDSGFLGVVGPLITANGLVGDVYLDIGDPVTIAVQMMNIEPYLGAEVDWWVVAFAHSGEWYYLDSAPQWQEAPFSGDYTVFHPVYQGGLVNLASTPVLSGFTLPSGTYDFWFAVDYPLDGILNLNGPILYDNVTVFVQ